MKGIFLFAMNSRLVLEPAQPPTQCVLGTLSLGVKWPGCEADHSPLSSAKVRNISIFMAQCLIKHSIFPLGMVLS